MHQAMSNIPHARRDYRDLCIETLTDDEAALVARIHDLTAERDSYRQLFILSLASLRELTLKTKIRLEPHGPEYLEMLEDAYANLRAMNVERMAA